MKTPTKNGFKQTEVGMIPEDWKVNEFKALFKVPLRNGLTRPTAVRGGGIKMVNMGELFAHDRIRNTIMERVPVSDKEKQDYLLSRGDLIFARQSLLISGVGKCSIFLEDDEEVTFEGHLIRVRLSEDYSPMFYYYFFKSERGRTIIQGFSEQVAASGIRGSDLAKIPVPVPSLAEQQSISRILSDLDSKIELNGQMNRTLEAIGKAIFKHWFIDFEFPNEEGKPYKSSGGEMVYNEEMGREIPIGWQPDRLGNHTIIKGRIGWKGLQVSEYVDEGPYIVGGKQLVGNRVSWSDCPRVPQQRYDESPEIMLRESDILMTKDGTIGKLAFVNELREPATVASGIFVIRSNSSIINQMYLWNYFKSDTFRWLVETRIEGSVVPHLYQRDITELQIVLPTQRIASQFESVALSIQHKIAANSEFSLKLDTIRDLLLPRLISGKIRVPVEVG